jgi:hypothetical protein
MTIKQLILDLKTATGLPCFYQVVPNGTQLDFICVRRESASYDPADDTGWQLISHYVVELCQGFPRTETAENAILKYFADNYIIPEISEDYDESQKFYTIEFDIDLLKD